MALIHEQLVKVMQAVSGLAKRERAPQGFIFRGIDAVLNAVGPALREHQVFIAPVVKNIKYETVEVGQRRTLVGHVLVTVQFTFFAVDGSELPVQVVGEAMDSGDKAVSKAMSVALRIALLQTLALPTDEKDPDVDHYERATTHHATPATPANTTTQPTTRRPSARQATPTPVQPAPRPARQVTPPPTQPEPTPRPTPSQPPPTTRPDSTPAIPTPPAAASPPHSDPTAHPAPAPAPAVPTSQPDTPLTEPTGRPHPAPDDETRQAILDWAQQNNVSPVEVAERFRVEMDGDIRTANVEALNNFYAMLSLGGTAVQ